MKLSTTPSSIAPISVPGRLPSPPSTQIANTRPIYSRPTDGSTGWMTISSAPAIDAVAIEIANAMRLIRVGDRRHQLQRELVLRHGHDGAADEGLGQENLQRRDQRQRHEARHQHAQRQVDEAELPGRPDIGRLHVAVVDAEHQDQRDLGDEQQAEEEREAAQRVLPAPLERLVVDLVDQRAERIEDRQHDDARQDRIDAQPRVDDVGDVGAEDDEARMRDVDDVEDAERDRNADGHGRIERAEQQARDQRVDEQVVWNVHHSPRMHAARRTSRFFNVRRSVEAAPAEAAVRTSTLRARLSGMGSGLLALSRNSTVMKFRSASPILARSCTLNWPFAVLLMAGFAGLVGVLHHAAVADIGARLAVGGDRPEIVEHVAVEPEALAGLEPDLPDPHALVLRQEPLADATVRVRLLALELGRDLGRPSRSSRL